MKNATRRRLLQTVAALSTVSLAGCGAQFGDAQTATATPGYEQLTQTAVYTSEDVGIRLPEDVEQVATATNADLVVVHGNPDVDAEQAVAWLTDERVVALVGDRAQATWLDWAESEDYRNAFESQGRAAADPAPYLLVAAASGTDVSTHRFSWGTEPSNEDVVRALDEALVEIVEDRES